MRLLLRALLLSSLGELREQRHRKRKHGGGAAATVAAPSGPTTYAADTFTRSDRSLNGDTPETGSAWAALSGTWNIISNKAQTSIDPGTNVALVIDDGAADGYWRLTVTQQSKGGFTIRATDNSNYIMTRSIPTDVTIYRVTAGVRTIIGTFSGAQAAGDVYLLQATGDQISVSQNGTLRIGPLTESQGQTVTKSGLNVWDWFTILDDYSHASV